MFLESMRGPLVQVAPGALIVSAAGEDALHYVRAGLGAMLTRRQVEDMAAFRRQECQAPPHQVTTDIALKLTWPSRHGPEWARYSPAPRSEATMRAVGVMPLRRPRCPWSADPFHQHADNDAEPRLTWGGRRFPKLHDGDLAHLCSPVRDDVDHIGGDTRDV
jgi:hypothetical protein